MTMTNDWMNTDLSGPGEAKTPRALTLKLLRAWGWDWERTRDIVSSQKTAAAEAGDGAAVDLANDVLRELAKAHLNHREALDLLQKDERAAMILKGTNDELAADLRRLLK